MNKKKMIPILTLCAILTIVVIAMVLGARPKPAKPLDELTQTADTESQTETETETSTLTEPSESEAEPVTEEMETASEEEVTEEEVDTEELERVRAIDERNKEIFAKNKELPTVVAYSGVDTSEVMGIDDYEVGGIFYQDEMTREDYFIYADCSFSELLACIIPEPLTEVIAPEDMSTPVLLYQAKSASHTYYITYDNEKQELLSLYKDERYWFVTLTPEDVEIYTRNLTSDDASVSSGCGCGCGSDGGCGTGSECGDDDSCGNQ